MSGPNFQKEADGGNGFPMFGDGGFPLMCGPDAECCPGDPGDPFPPNACFCPGLERPSSLTLDITFQYSPRGVASGDVLEERIPQVDSGLIVTLPITGVEGNNICFYSADVPISLPPVQHVFDDSARPVQCIAPTPVTVPGVNELWNVTVRMASGSGFLFMDVITENIVEGDNNPFSCLDHQQSAVACTDRLDDSTFNWAIGGIDGFFDQQLFEQCSQLITKSDLIGSFWSGSVEWSSETTFKKCIPTLPGPNCLCTNQVRLVNVLYDYLVTRIEIVGVG